MSPLFVLVFPSPLSLPPRFLSFASFSGIHPLSSSRSPFLYPSFSLFLFSLLPLLSFDLTFSLSRVCPLPICLCSNISLNHKISPSCSTYLPLCLKISTRSLSRPHVSSFYLLSPYLSRSPNSSYLSLLLILLCHRIPVD